MCLHVPSNHCSSFSSAGLPPTQVLQHYTTLCSLCWLPVAAEIRFKTLVFAYRATNDCSPSCMQPTPATLCYCLLFVLAPQRWNQHHIEIRSAKTIQLFHRRLNHHLFRMKKQIKTIILSVTECSTWRINSRSADWGEAEVLAWFLDFIHMVECTHCKLLWIKVSASTSLTTTFTLLWWI